MPKMKALFIIIGTIILTGIVYVIIEEIKRHKDYFD